MKVYLIRHAKTMDSQLQISQSDDASIIRPTPIEILPIIPEKVFSSPLLRAKQTAQLLYPNNFEVVDYIYEYRRPRFLTGKNQTLAENFWQTAIEHMKADIHWKHDGSESFYEIKERAQKFLLFLQSIDFTTVAVVGHGIFFRYLLGVHAYGDDFDQEDSFNLMKTINWANLEWKEIDI